MDMTTEGSDSSDDDFEGDSDVEPASSKPASKSVQTSGSRRSAGRPRRSTSKTSIIDVSDSSEDEIMSPVRKRPAPAGKPVKVKAEPVAVKPAQVKAEPAAAAAPAIVQVRLQSLFYITIMSCQEWICRSLKAPWQL